MVVNVFAQHCVNDATRLRGPLELDVRHARQVIVVAPARRVAESLLARATSLLTWWCATVADLCSLRSAQFVEATVG